VSFWLPVLFSLVYLSEFSSATCGEIASRARAGIASLSSRNRGAQNMETAAERLFPLTNEMAMADLDARIA
jgi:hypothetical protein